MSFENVGGQICAINNCLDSDQRIREEDSKDCCMYFKDDIVIGSLKEALKIKT